MNQATAHPAGQNLADQKKVAPLTENKEFKFRWKKDNLGNQRQSIEVKAGVPTLAGFIDILELQGKGFELLQESAARVIRDAIGSYLADNENAKAEDLQSLTTKIGDKVLPMFSWEAIANQPASERQTIDAELWTEFGADYQEIMPSVTGKSKEAVGNAVLIFQKKFSVVKSNKPVLKVLKEQLGLYINATKNGEKFADILDLLNRKVDTYLGSNDVEMLVSNL